MTTSVGPEIDALVRRDGGRMLSRLVADIRDFQLAEDSLQDALEAALVHWDRSGLPRSPVGWLLQTARRKAIDRIRRSASFRSKSAELTALIELDRDFEPVIDADPIADERLKLIFTCCHPALAPRISVALTLRSVCGLKTEEIARAFVMSPEAMAQRLVRARHKIAKAGIAYEVPEADGWGERLQSVLAVIYLVFNEGYAASSGELVRGELCDEAIRLGRLVHQLCPGEPEVEGLRALMLLHHARSNTRLGLAGELVTLEGQDRTQWDREMIGEAREILQGALRRGRAGLYQLQAVIAMIHADAPSFAETDWTEIALIYDSLIAVEPNPVFELNRVVALSYAVSAEVALKRLERVGTALETYQPYHAVRADLLVRLGEIEAARAAFARAIALSGSAAEQRFLENKLRAFCGQGCT